MKAHVRAAFQRIHADEAAHAERLLALLLVHPSEELVGYIPVAVPA